MANPKFITAKIRGFRLSLHFRESPFHVNSNYRLILYFLRGCVTKFYKLSSVSFRRFIYLLRVPGFVSIDTAILRYNFFNLSVLEIYAGMHYTVESC